MTTREISGRIDVVGFGHEIQEFLADTRATIDYAFADGTVDASPAVWHVDGIVRGVHRVMPIGGPDPTRRLALLPISP